MGVSLAAKECSALENMIYPVQNFYIFVQILFTSEYRYISETLQTPYIINQSTRLVIS